MLAGFYYFLGRWCSRA